MVVLDTICHGDKMPEKIKKEAKMLFTSQFPDATAWSSRSIAVLLRRGTVSRQREEQTELGKRSVLPGSW